MSSDRRLRERGMTLSNPTQASPGRRWCQRYEKARTFDVPAAVVTVTGTLDAGEPTTGTVTVQEVRTGHRVCAG
jgi:hypothetical protein